MITLPDEVVHLQVRQAVDDKVPKVLVAIHGNLQECRRVQASTGKYLRKKGYNVQGKRVFPSYDFLHFPDTGMDIEFTYFEDEKDVKAVHGYAGMVFNRVLSNVPMAFDSNQRTHPLLYLMSRVRGEY